MRRAMFANYQLAVEFGMNVSELPDLLLALTFIGLVIGDYLCWVNRGLKKYFKALGQIDERTSGTGGIASPAGFLCLLLLDVSAACCRQNSQGHVQPHPAYSPDQASKRPHEQYMEPALSSSIPAWVRRDPKILM